MLGVAYRSSVLLGAAFLLLSGACARPRQSLKPLAAKGALAEVASAFKQGLGEQGGEQGGEQERGRRAQDPTLYVDGAPIAALTYLELPPSLPTRWQPLTSGRLVRRFRVAELLEALGIDLAAVKQVHFYGGRDRISIVDGAELRRMKNELLFSFTQSDRGKPRMHYPDEEMKLSGRIDMIDTIAVYVQREPPRSEGKYQTLTFADGRPIEGIPYASGERPGGTRVYVDGALRTFVKRKSLPASAAEPGAPSDAPPRYLLWSYADALDISRDSVKALELLGSDAVLARLDASALASRPLVFTLPRRSRGLLAMDLPEVTEPVQAIMFYINKLPPDRAANSHPPDVPDSGELKKKKR